MKRKVKYLFLIVICFLIFSAPVYAKEVGLHDTPYSISKAYPTVPTESEYPTLEYGEWQATGDFQNLYENGNYVIRVRDKLGNTAYYPFKITGLAMLFEVEFIDVADDKSVLGSTTKLMSVGKLITGADLGTDSTIGKYYAGHSYESCTGTTVSAFEKNVVYRNFKAQMLNVTYHALNGDVFGSEKIRYGSNASFQSEPVKDTVSTDSETIKYTFKGWADKEGNLVSLTAVTEDMDLYPVFEEEHLVAEITIAFHYLDAKDTVVYVTGRRGEIDVPEPTKEDIEDEKGRTWFSFEYWTTADGSRVFDFGNLKSIDLYAHYSEEYVPNYESPEEEELEIEEKEIEEVEVLTETVLPSSDDTPIRFITEELESAKGIVTFTKNILDENRDTVATVAKVGISVAAISLLTYAATGFGVVQSVIFLWALYKKNKRYVHGVWLLGEDDIKYVNRFGQEVIATKDEKGYHFKTKRGKVLNGVDVRKELRKLEACRINQREFMKAIKESEVYTVFNKDVRLEFGNAQNTNKVLGFNLFGGIRNLGENVSHYSMKIVNGSKEIMYDIKQGEVGVI